MEWGGRDLLPFTGTTTNPNGVTQHHPCLWRVLHLNIFPPFSLPLTVKLTPEAAHILIRILLITSFAMSSPFKGPQQPHRTCVEFHCIAQRPQLSSKQEWQAPPMCTCKHCAVHASRRGMLSRVGVVETPGATPQPPKCRARESPGWACSRKHLHRLFAP